MLLDNLNFLLRERGAPLLSAEDFLGMDPPRFGELVDELGMPLEILLHVDLAKRNEIVRSKDIRLVVLDVDGVLTDGGLYYLSNGEDAKRFDVKDGMAITRAAKNGIEFGIISASSKSEVIRYRAEVLGIGNVYVGKTPKIEVLESWLYEKGLSYDNVAYLGDDINDVEVLKKAGLSAVPADAVPSAKRAADIVLRNPGGRGCVREFVEYYLEAMG
jgi:3-deoxy-D-manno-octulosonate 8-phosphate phosphatase (KDO 8-P phosphatase)